MGVDSRRARLPRAAPDRLTQGETGGLLEWEIEGESQSRRLLRAPRFRALETYWYPRLVGSCGLPRNQLAGGLRSTSETGDPVRWRGTRRVGVPW